MTQANIPTLPQLSAVAPARQAGSGRAGNPDPDGGDQAFPKVLDRRLNPEPPRPAARPAGKAERAAGEKPATAGKAPPDPPPDAPATPRAGLGVVPDAISSGDSAQAEAPAALPDQPLDGAATDPLLASLAGLPAALAALMGAATPAATGAASTPDGAAQVTGDATGRNPGAALARLLGEAAGGHKDLSAIAATGSDEAGAVPTASEEDDSFATALAALSGPDERRTVLSAVATTDTGPASAAADTAQAAANPGAGDAALHAGAAAAQAATPVRNHREDASLHLHVAQPPNHPGWADSVADRVTWLAGQHESKADLVLTPPQLGRVEVSLTVNGDQTTAQFVAATPAAREALEQALPRLREALAEAGIQLAQSGVSTSDQHNAREQHARQGSPRHAGDGPPAGEVTPSGGAWRQSGRGLVDTFA